MASTGPLGADMLSPIPLLVAMVVGTRLTMSGLFRHADVTGLDLLLLFVAWAYVYVCPFTKVEESFNIQAAHDLLIFGPVELEKFDHFEFPGVVPRTFLGAIATAILAAPFHLAAAAHGAPKIWALTFVRASLAFLVWVPLTRLGRALGQHYGSTTIRNSFLLICVTQFHFLFYCSRPLPNTFGLVLVLWAYTLWVQRKFSGSVRLFAAATLIFRCDTLILCAPVGVSMLLRRQISFPAFLWAAVTGAAASVALTVAVDSYFWSRLIWPELDVFWFNVILNKSADYGVQPLLWYLTSALPRMLLVSAAFLGASLLVPRRLWQCLRGPGAGATEPGDGARNLSWELVLPMIAFVGLYSLLPHKELRFILYCVPALNAASAVGFARALDVAQTRGSKGSSFLSKVLAMFIFAGIAVAIIANAAACAVFVRAASLNYPGGYAALRLVEHLQKSQPTVDLINVHVDNLAAQSGFSRFSQIDSLNNGAIAVHFDKTEHLDNPGQFADYTHLVTENATFHKDRFVVVGEAEHVFSHLSRSGFTLDFATEPALYLMQRSDL